MMTLEGDHLTIQVCIAIMDDHNHSSGASHSWSISSHIRLMIKYIDWFGCSHYCQSCTLHTVWYTMYQTKASMLTRMSLYIAWWSLLVNCARSETLQWPHNGQDGVSNHQPHHWKICIHHKPSTCQQVQIRTRAFYLVGNLREMQITRRDASSKDHEWRRATFSYHDPQ